MVSLTLKNLPDPLLRDLRRAAKKDRRSLTQEIIHLLDAALRSRNGRPSSRSTELDTQLVAWRKLAGKWESNVDRASEMEQLIKSRTPGREIDF